MRAIQFILIHGGGAAYEYSPLNSSYILKEIKESLLTSFITFFFLYIKRRISLSPFSLPFLKMAASGSGSGREDGGMRLTVASVMEDVLQQHGNGLRDHDLDSRRAEEAGKYPFIIYFDLIKI